MGSASGVLVFGPWFIYSRPKYMSSLRFNGAGKEMDVVHYVDPTRKEYTQVETSVTEALLVVGVCFLVQ